MHFSVECYGLDSEVGELGQYKRMKVGHAQWAQNAPIGRKNNDGICINPIVILLGLGKKIFSKSLATEKSPQASACLMSCKPGWLKEEMEVTISQDRKVSY